MPEDTNENEILTAKQAEALAQHRSFILQLNGLTVLSDKAVKALGQHEGYLCFDGLTRLFDEAADALRANPMVRLPDRFKRQ